MPGLPSTADASEEDDRENIQEFITKEDIMKKTKGANWLSCQ